MCGIAGFYSSKGRFSEVDLKAMTNSLAHRGPDAEGYFFDGICGLGHRRLSILDLSSEANQPMYTESRRYVMVFNGEVYNYQSLKEKLPTEKRNALKTTGDTEVLLALFEHYGEEAVHWLNGMFAIAIYDKQQQTLWLCRDRIGIKPLYYYWNGQHFAFASELKALCHLPIPKAIHTPAIVDFLHLGYIPAPKSIYQNIYKLPAGHFMRVSQHNLQQFSYWSLAAQLTDNLIEDEPTAKQQLKELLQQAVRYRLVSDVPLGVFLSGGIDSSLVASLATEQAEGRINSFSIGFQEHQFNEAAYAKKVASHLGTNHHELNVSTKEAKALIPQLIDFYDEPYADSSAIPTLLVAKLARQHVTVALGGDGGDELFLGYGMYQWAERLHNPFYRTFRWPIAQLLKLGKQSRFQKAYRMFNTANTTHLPSHIFSQEQLFFTQQEIQALLCHPIDYQFTPRFPEGKTHAASQSLFDLSYYLPDDLLVKIDRATMRSGLEARVPLLDHQVVAFALQLSTKLKYRQGERKYLLKQVLYDYVPKHLFDRPKQGFSIPLVRWLRGDLKYLIENHLSEKNVNHYRVINYNKVNQIKKAYLAGNDYFYNRLWSLIILHQFLEKHESNK